MVAGCGLERAATLRQFDQERECHGRWARNYAGGNWVDRHSNRCSRRCLDGRAKLEPAHGAKYPPGIPAGVLAIWSAGWAVFFIVYTAVLFAGMALAGVRHGASMLLTIRFVLWCPTGAMVIVLNLELQYGVTRVRCGRGTPRVSPASGSRLRRPSDSTCTTSCGWTIS